MFIDCQNLLPYRELHKAFQNGSHKACFRKKQDSHNVNLTDFKEKQDIPGTDIRHKIPTMLIWDTELRLPEILNSKIL